MHKPSVTAFAPASVGNVASGFDILGHALAGQGDRVTVRGGTRPGVRIRRIEGLNDQLPITTERNTAGRAVQSLMEAFDQDVPIELDIHKGIPLASGLGGSAASAVAAVVAANAWLGLKLSPRELYPFALAGEAVASGSAHGDNIAPQLLGGLVLVAEDELIELPVPEGLTAVAVHPHCQVRTAEARAMLQQPFELKPVVQQTTYLAQLIAGCYRNDLPLVARGLKDVLIEPRRSSLIPGFEAVQQAALEHGALAAAISGAGPTVCAWLDGLDSAQAVAGAMQAAFKQHGLDSEHLICPVDSPGACIEVID